MKLATLRRVVLAARATGLVRTIGELGGNRLEFVGSARQTAAHWSDSFEVRGVIVEVTPARTYARRTTGGTTSAPPNETAFLRSLGLRPCDRHEASRHRESLRAAFGVEVLYGDPSIADPAYRWR